MISITNYYSHSPSILDTIRHKHGAGQCHINLAYAYSQQGKYQEARREFKLAETDAKETCEFVVLYFIL